MADSSDLLDGLDFALPQESLSSAPTEEAANSFVGPYQLIQEVGSGGVARVYRARHIHPQYADRALVVKVLHSELSDDPKVIALFRREAYVLALLKHPNIVQTFEAGAQDERLFIAMEYIDGRDLDNLLMRCARGKLAVPMPILLHIVGEVLRALTYAHEMNDNDGNRMNLVHRDVNPANVFVSFDGRIKLGDFGVAAITAGRVEKSRELAGKVGYFAPEQLSGDPVDGRADLFAMGVMMFEMFCGTRLFDHEDVNQSMRLNKKAKVPKPSKINPAISPQLERIMLKALERKPNDRFPSGREMLAALAPLLPDPAGMNLAVGALMRTAFLQEHLQELQLREGLAGKSTARQGKRVDVVMAEPRAQQAFRELLQSRGYEVRTHSDLESLVDAWQPLPIAMFIDVAAPNFSEQDANVVLKSADGYVPVIAVSQDYGDTTIKHAQGIGAADLLVRPFQMERVLSAVRTAISARTTSTQAAPPRAQEAPRMLLVSRDSAWAKVVQDAMSAGGWRVDVVPDGSKALEWMEHSSCRLTVYDAFPGSTQDRLFVSQLRSHVGMGLVPVMYAIDDAARTLFSGMLVERVMVLNRRTPPAELLKAVDTLRRDSPNSRIFIRYDADFPAELRYGGRVFSCSGTNISRGGVMMLCEQIPPVGTQVSVVMRLNNSRVLASGRVMRVDLVKRGAQDMAQVGIEFETFVDRGEPELIQYLYTLAGAGAEDGSYIPVEPAARAR